METKIHLASGLEKVLQSGEVIDELAGFPYDSVYHLEPKDKQCGARITSELYDVDGDRRGVGTLIYPAGKGWIIVLAHDPCRVNYRLASDSYRRFLTFLLDETGYEPEVRLSGDLFVHPLLYETPQRRLVVVNYNSYRSQVGCCGPWVANARMIDMTTGEVCDPGSITVPPLGIRIVERHSCSNEYRTSTTK